MADEHESGTDGESAQVVEVGMRSDDSKSAVPMAASTTHPKGVGIQLKPTGRFKLLSADELAALLPLRWIIRDLLPEKGLALVVGAPTAGKTFVALDIAAHVSLGLDWFGFPTRAAPVVYVGLEAQHGIQKRMNAWKEHHASKLPATLKFILQPFNMLQPDSVDEMASDVLAAIGRGGVIIVDTLNQATTGADENSSVDMGRIIQAAMRLQVLTDSLVVLVHHKGKNESAGARGHSSLTAAADAVIAVNDKGGQRHWSTYFSQGGKAKEAEAVTRAFELRGVELGLDADGQPADSAVVVPTIAKASKQRPLSATQSAAMQAFQVAARAHGRLDVNGHFAGLALDDWRAQVYRTSTAASAEAKKKSFQRVRTDLLASGHITVANDIYRLAGVNSVLEDSIAEVLRGKAVLTGTHLLLAGQGTPGTSTGQCPDTPTQNGDTAGHNSLECVRSPDGRDTRRSVGSQRSDEVVRN